MKVNTSLAKLLIPAAACALAFPAFSQDQRAPEGATAATKAMNATWFDGNPAMLHPLPPVAAAKRYVDYLGGADAAISKAKRSFADGNYRWVAQVMN